MQDKQELFNLQYQERDLLKSENNLLRQEIHRLQSFIKNPKQITVPYDDTQVLLDQTLLQRLHIDLLEKECSGLEERYEDLLETYQKDLQKMNKPSSELKESSYLENSLETIQKKNQQLEKQLADLSKNHVQLLNQMKMKYYEQQALISNNRSEDNNNLIQSYNQKQALKILQTPKKELDFDVKNIKQSQAMNTQQPLHNKKLSTPLKSSRVIIKDQNNIFQQQSEQMSKQQFQMSQTSSRNGNLFNQANQKKQ